MSTSQSAPNSQSVPEGNSQPSSTPELQSNTGNTQTSSQCHDEPDVVIISDEKEDKDLKKGKSEVWKHFDRVRIDNCIKAVCKYCGAKLRGDSKSGTSHLHNHYNTKHHNKGQISIRQKLLSSNFNKDHPELASLNFNAEGARNELAKMIIMHEYPISIVDHVGFKRYSSYLQPLFKVPCRNTIKKETMLVSPHRNRLHPKTLEALMCAQSWLWAAEMPGYATIYNDHESEDSCITREV